MSLRRLLPSFVLVLCVMAPLPDARAYEEAALASIVGFLPMDAATRQSQGQAIDGLRTLLGGERAAPPAQGEQALVYARTALARGTMDGFGYSFLADKPGDEAVAALPLQGPQTYEALNLVDGRRSVAQIHEWLLAEFGRADADAVAKHLQSLAAVGIISPKVLP